MKCNFKIGKYEYEAMPGKTITKTYDPPKCGIQMGGITVDCPGEESCVVCAPRDIQVKGWKDQ